MIKVLTAEMMRGAERDYMSATGTSPLELVGRAARHVYMLVKRLSNDGRATFACGSGGNGADGFTAARLFAESGGQATIVLSSEPSRLSNDARVSFDSALATPGVVLSDEISASGVFVDAMLGIGLKRPVSGRALEIILAINACRTSGAKVIAVDIPSGLDADTGMALGGCVEATHTVTFEAEKPGHLLGIGPDVCGIVSVESIGIPESCIPKNAIFHPDTDDARKALKPRPRLSHKGTFGHVLIIAGSLGMAGAAAMAATAALRSGAGLVSIACPKSIVGILQTLAPSAMCIALDDRDGVISESAIPRAIEAFRGKSSIVIGPGITTRAPSGLLSACLTCGLPSVIDADALNIISQSDGLKRLFTRNHVITPHPGEAARLLGKTVTDALACARELSQLGATVVLKGAATVIASEKTYISTTGCAGLAKGGSGDVLSGMIGALLAQGYEPFDASWIADTFHGALGEITARNIGQTAMTSRDLIDHMRYLWGDGAV